MRGILMASAVLALGLGGCATIVEGTSQDIMVASDPSGATCTVSRGGNQIAAVIATPAKIHIDKSKNDLAVTCTKQGYEPTTAIFSPKFNGTTFGNILIGGVAGAVVDASTGASYNYPTDMSIAMPQSVAAAPAAAPVVAAAPASPVAAKTTTAAAPAPKPAAAAAAAPVAAAAPAPAASAAPAAKPTETASASGVIAPDPLTRTMKPVAD